MAGTMLGPRADETVGAKRRKRLHCRGRKHRSDADEGGRAPLPIAAVEAHVRARATSVDSPRRHACRTHPREGAPPLSRIPGSSSGGATEAEKHCRQARRRRWGGQAASRSGPRAAEQGAAEEQTGTSLAPAPVGRSWPSERARRARSRKASGIKKPDRSRRLLNSNGTNSSRARARALVKRRHPRLPPQPLSALPHLSDGHQMGMLPLHLSCL